MMEEFKSRQEIRDQLKNDSKNGLDLSKNKRHVIDSIPLLHATIETDIQITTNICISNLPRTFDEEKLFSLFRKFGPIASVKIMWPWSDNEYARGYNLAFVAFFYRNDAEKAMLSLQGATFDMTSLKMSWSKPIFNSSQPFCIFGDDRKSLEPVKVRGKVNKLCSWKSKISWKQNNTCNTLSNMQLRFMINLLESSAFKTGLRLEHLIIHNQEKGKIFEFLRQKRGGVNYHSQHYTLPKKSSMVNTCCALTKVTKKVFLVYNSKRTAENKIKRKKNDDSSEKSFDFYLSKFFQKLLREMKGTTNGIEWITMFTFIDLNTLQDKFKILGKSITLAPTPILIKVIRLFLLSDIIYTYMYKFGNSIAISKKLGIILPIYFKSIASSLKDFIGKNQECEVKAKIVSLVRSWVEKSIFSSNFLARLLFIYFQSNLSSNISDNFDSNAFTDNFTPGMGTKNIYTTIRHDTSIKANFFDKVFEFRGFLNGFKTAIRGKDMFVVF